jgi:spore maturation protein A
MQAIWVLLLVGGFLLSALTGNIAAAGNGVFEGAASAVKLCIELIGAYMLWLGVLNIAQKSGLVEAIAQKLRGIMSFLFPSVKKDSPAFGFITLNIVANMLGLGNAATPFGISAMQEMQRGRKSVVATDAMCMFLVINSSSVQLFPATVVSMRSAAGSLQPADIVLPALIATACSTLVGILMVKLLQKRRTQRQYAV